MVARTRRLLVVEDSEELLNMLSRSLAAEGYEVLWARDGEDALKLLTRETDPIGAMIVDVVLPGMTGPELVEAVRREHPETRAIYVSAFDAETVRSHGVDPEVVPFLSKPYDPDDLIRGIQETLDRA